MKIRPAIVAVSLEIALLASPARHVSDVAAAQNPMAALENAAK